MAVAVRSDLEADSSLAQQLVRMRHAIDLQELAFSRLAAEFATTDFYEEDGAATPIDWIRFHCNMTSNAAADRVAVGERLESLTRSVAATVAGEIGFSHVVVMARTAEAVGDAFDERELLDKAVASTPGKFRFICRHYRHAADPDAYAAEQESLAENRRLSLSTWEDGSLLVNGVLDPEGGAVLRGALEPLARPCGEHDHRDRDRRLADALVELAGGGVPKVDLQVTSSVETLLALAGAPAADMEFSVPVSSKTVERMACDSRLARILMQESVVIDVGRSRRVVSAPARKALEARDRHCRWPGCDRPAKWSAAHHVVHWIHGGVTDLNNLVLLCHRHHRMVHEGGWQLVKSEDGIVTIPPTVMFGPRLGPDPPTPLTA